MNRHAHVYGFNIRLFGLHVCLCYAFGRAITNIYLSTPHKALPIVPPRDTGAQLPKLQEIPPHPPICTSNVPSSIPSTHKWRKAYCDTLLQHYPHVRWRFAMPCIVRCKSLGLQLAGRCEQSRCFADRRCEACHWWGPGPSVVDGAVATAGIRGDVDVSQGNLGRQPLVDEYPGGGRDLRGLMT